MRGDSRGLAEPDVVAMNERKVGETTLQGARRATRLRISILSVAVKFATKHGYVTWRSLTGGEALFLFLRMSQIVRVSDCGANGVQAGLWGQPHSPSVVTAY